jgi:[protein-PII] uridylyltransferase
MPSPAPVIGRIQKHARERLHFTEAASRADRLVACKTFLRLESAMIRMRHDGGESGLKVAQARSAMVDVLLAHLFNFALGSYERSHGALPSAVSLLALGGYGRGELNPLSDIDIMFLFPPKVKPAAVQPMQQHLIDEVLYILWDCGLKVGHSTRTVDDVFAEARKDIQTKTALLEARLIAGGDALFQSFSQAYHSFYTQDDPKAYIGARLADQAIRRAKYGDTVFLQEPDVKNGVGGLRDFQNTLWMARVKLGIDSIDQLVEQSYLLRNELRDFKRGYEFLLRVRNELHFQSKRPTDLLDLEAQPRIAFGLGYTNQDLLGRVEQFMHDYYHAAQAIYRTSKLVENRLALTLEATAGKKLSFREVVRAHRYQKAKRIDGFILRGNELTAETASVFRDDPVRLVRVFRHCQSLEAQPDFALQTLIRESLPLITRRVTHDSAANLSFKTILEAAGSVYPTLALMHELGVLGRFIPEFQGLTCLVQHEFYHRYTADIHTLSTIRELDLIFTASDPVTQKYRAVLHETINPTLLYLILLLHDIGKAKGIKGHADFGVDIALPLLARMEVEATEQEIVTFIIKNHLIMARFWQKRDIDDPASAIAFSALVPDPDKLRYLYVHTFCDARGTAAGLWNSYKDTLHGSLYRATLDQLIHGPNIALRNTARMQSTYQELVAKRIPGISADEITAHFHLLPERYFIHTGADEIALHIRMVNRLLSSISTTAAVGSLKPVIDWHDDLNRSLTVVDIVTSDRAGLFYKLAGAFSVAGLSILSAKVNSRNDHIAIDTFYVVEPGRGVVQSAKLQEIFERTIEEALVTDKDLYPDIVAQAKKVRSSRFGSDKVSALPASFPPTVEVYHELSMQRTIVEVQALDEIGLLFRLAKIISDHGFDITFARIGTEREIAIDSFYIESARSEREVDTARLALLQTALAEVIAPPTALPVGTV